MAKTLVIVESPTKARTIKRYLGQNYAVEATMGHIKDLPKTVLGVDIENEFTPSYRVKPDKRDVVKKLKKAAASAKEVFLASDPDREGEAIAWHVAEEIKQSKSEIKRIIFHEITKKAIKEALDNPKELDQSLYQAQIARRSLDRIVGYTMSPLLWKKVKRGLSGGRVQSVALRLICMRQEEIEAFISQEYWTIEAMLASPCGKQFPAKVVIPKEIPNQEAAENIEKAIRNASRITISQIKKKTRTRQSAPPFITSTLQQEASKKLRFTAKKTMVIAQQLYEGLSIGGEEITGLITYMRTDSPNISQEALDQVRTFIPDNFGQDYLPDKPRKFKAKKSAQEAHEAIRPTSLQHSPGKLKAHLSRDQLNLYELIWRRFIASQMKEAIFHQTAIEIQADEISLRSTGSILIFDGFLKIYQTQEDKDVRLPDTIKQGDDLTLIDLEPKQHFTQPPAHYTEASLIKELEDKGIGRPSTYAPTISTIQDRGYVNLESGAFIPTELGRNVNNLLVKNYPQILDIGFTARMEENLDKIEEGSAPYLKIMETFYEIYNNEHELAQKNMENLKMTPTPSGITCELCGAQLNIKLGKNGYFLGCSSYPDCTNTKEFTRDESGKILIKELPKPEQTDIVCDKCGSAMIIKHGKFGAFLSCSNYPDCKNTKPLKQPETTQKKCDKCGSAMVVKRGRYGLFLACSKYPECKNIKPYTLDMKCPLPCCTGEITQQRTKKGKTFYTCSNKECQFISWTKPIEKKCPVCKADFLLKKGQKATCPNPECDYEE
ncbi:MAG: type I DNA topoisomerase [Deltaproteobacteria bacterium]|nr:type I DNA topoisomerase [Deltaproteobacteria bacterium]